MRAWMAGSLDQWRERCAERGDPSSRSPSDLTVTRTRSSQTDDDGSHRERRSFGIWTRPSALRPLRSARNSRGSESRSHSATTRASASVGSAVRAAGSCCEGFRRLTPESRYRRFLAPTPKLSERTVRYLVEIDHRNHEALIALDERLGGAVGVARYVRDRARPDAAEVAVTVVDDWQGRGLGTLLLEGITMRAREEGVDTFTALMLAENGQMMDLLERLGAVRVVDRAAGTVEVEVHLPAIGVTPELRKLIRLAAASDIAIPIGELPR